MQRKEYVLIGGIFTVVVAVLGLAYFLLLRQDYVILFADIREQDTAEIVEELGRLGLDYRLADGGHAILVPEDSEEEARIAIAGADIAMGGVVGFELFNESDMGLTEFAQQVNYQRALQGELARTIMMMDGIAFARVHVSLPERTLFRDEELIPQAAVAIQPRPGHVINGENVAGIQRLIASSVPELTVDRVSVLDQHGRLVSLDPPVSTLGQPELGEQEALEAYFRARAREAVEPLLPGVEFAIRVNAVRFFSRDRSDDAAEEITDGRQEARRDFALNVALRTKYELAAEDQATIRDMIAQAVALEPANGDTIRLEVADLVTSDPATLAAPPVIPSPTAPAVNSTIEAPVTSNQWITDLLFSRWALLLLLLVVIIVLPILRRRSRMNNDEHLSFAEEIELLLTRREERSHG